MQPSSPEPTWDFTPVFNLLHSLGSQEAPSTPGTPSKEPAHTRSPSHSTSTSTTIQLQPTLGNFTRLWDYLGVQRDSPSSPVVHFETSSKLGEAATNNAYASDGAIRSYAAEKERGWKSEGEHNPLDLTDSPTDGPTAPALTKNQRKKHNRKLRAAAAKATKAQPVSDVDVDGDADDDEEGPVSHKMPRPSRYIPSRHTRASSQKENKTPSTAVKNSSSLFTPAPKPQTATELVPPATPQTIQEARTKVEAATTAARTRPQEIPVHSASTSAKTIHESLQKHWRPAVESNSTHYAFNTPTKQNPRAQDQPPLPFPVIESKPAARLRHTILPLQNQTSVERNWSLLLKLLSNFPEDRKHLVSPLQLSINRPQPDGIHVFVDASNILIGFYDHLKLSRGIPKDAKTPRVDLNFHALALLLERRRPAAKRVLAGSTPEILAFEEARQVGYETCILDKVFKAKELTEKQKRIKSRELHAMGLSDVSGNESAGNGNSAADHWLQEAKWVEQAVDEILHLKILESVVDTPISPDAVSPYSLDNPNKKGTPASKDLFATSPAPPTRPTMVLATGDAAEAEYSPGFRKMVERALKSGWMVEVAAFGRSVSRDYRRMEKMPLAKGGWGERFKIIELDSYAEELFGEEL